MGNVGDFKARITLETEQYLSSWKRVEQATSSSTGGIAKALEKAGASWGRAMQKAFVGLFGIQLADTLARSIDERMKNPIFEDAGSNLAYAVGEGFQKTLQSIPVAGVVGGWIGSAAGSLSDFIGLTSDASGVLEARQQASRVEAEAKREALLATGEISKQMQQQTQLANAANEAERTRLERQFKFEEISRRINAEMTKVGFTPDQIRAEAERVRAAFDEQNAAADRLAAAKAEQLASERAILEAQREQADAQAAAAEEAQAVADRAAAREEAEKRKYAEAADFLTDMQRRLEERSMTEDELFQRKLDEMDLDEEQVAQAWKLHEALKEQAAIDPASATSGARSMANIEGISTAIGGVRIAGATSGLDRLAEPADETAENTRAMREVMTRERAAGSPP